MRSDVPAIRRASVRTLLAAAPVAALLLMACSSNSNNANANKVTAAAATKAASAPAAAAASSVAATAAATQAATSAPAGTAAAVATTVAAATGSSIKLGVLADITGPFSNEGTYIHLGTDLAVQRINASGGINGHKVEVVYADPKGDPAEAVRLARELVQQDHVDVLLGSVGSNECLAVEAGAPQLQIVYLASNACASDQFTSKACNKYSFRLYPTANQLTEPLVGFLVKSFGKKWAVIYADYAFGQSQLGAYKDGLAKVGGAVTLEIPVPQNEANVSPYVTKIPTDGSVDGVVVAFGGADLVRIISGIQQFGINKKVAVTAAIGKDFYGGKLPDALDGAIGVTVHPTDGIGDNAIDKQFDDDWKKIGDANRALAGANAYEAYIAITALRVAGNQAKFNGKADTDKLIAALESLNIPGGPDSPTGPLIMSKSDHQGAINVYVTKANGQKEDILDTISPDKLPPIGTCQAK